MKILFPPAQQQQSRSNSNTVLLLVLLLSSLFCLCLGDEQLQQQTCSWTSTERDPALKEMTYDVGKGPRSFWAYVEPDISTFYKDSATETVTKVVPKFKGLAGKFINMSNKPLNFYWESYEGGPGKYRHTFVCFFVWFLLFLFFVL
jgi:hypothetical protein